MPIPEGCICSAEGVYIYRGEGVHLSRGGVRLMPPKRKKIKDKRKKRKKRKKKKTPQVTPGSRFSEEGW